MKIIGSEINLGKIEKMKDPLTSLFAGPPNDTSTIDKSVLLYSNAKDLNKKKKSQSGRQQQNIISYTNLDFNIRHVSDQSSPVN